MQVDELLAERGGMYGDFSDISRTYCQIMMALGAGRNMRTGKIPQDQYTALSMIAMKMARIANGAPEHTDNWSDIIGYARLVERGLIAATDGDRAGAYTTVQEDDDDYS